VRVWNAALTGEQILANVDRKLTGKESNLVRYWNFDSGIPDDVTGFHNNGTLIGVAQIAVGPAVFKEPERPELIAGPRFSPTAGFRLSLQTVNTARTFQIEASTNLQQWSAVGFTVKVQVPGSVELTDPTATNFTSLRFYRARSTP